MTRKLDRRSHIVLIPGFGGFDALGQLEYYAGLTSLFREWQAQNGQPAVLHYYDSFPTASVSTRAHRLCRYLAKRIVRGEFSSGDTVALVGHSTGGLDIRRLLWNLVAARKQTFAVDGGEEIPAAEVLEFIQSVVFLSVPQWGTNIASWVRSNLLARSIVVSQLRASVAASQTPVVGRIQDLLGQNLAEVADLDLLRAIHDALKEAEADTGSDPTAAAAAHEAAADLELWLRHIAWDFAAIDDLSPGACTGEITDRTSPAHFPPSTRDREVRQWGRIRTRSYATISPPAFRFDSGKPAPLWDVPQFWTSPTWTQQTPESACMDLSYRYCYRACAGGPFVVPERYQVAALAPYGTREPRAIELWDSDGIVNTASMLWPNAADTVLIEADHMDIVGHYHRSRPGVYDLLDSASGFTDSEFSRVWTGIFDFCSSRAVRSAAGGM